MYAVTGVSCDGKFSLEILTSLAANKLPLSSSFGSLVVFTGATLVLAIIKCAWLHLSSTMQRYTAEAYALSDASLKT